MTPPCIVRVILYVRDIPKVASFYQRHFGMNPRSGNRDDWLELETSNGTCKIALHRASKAQKSGSAIKVVFGVSDVAGFKKEKAAEGLKFGAIHQIDGFSFANGKDPAGNSIQISSRGIDAR